MIATKRCHQTDSLSCGTPFLPKKLPGNHRMIPIPGKNRWFGEGIGLKLSVILHVWIHLMVFGTRQPMTPHRTTLPHNMTV